MFSWETLASGAVGGLVVSIANYFLSERSRRKTREFEIKKEIYVKLSRALKQFEVDKDEHKVVKEVHEILAEAYMIAPDNVILGIKKIWEDKQENNKIKGSNIVALISSLRGDLMSSTNLKEEDFFILEMPDG